MAVGELDSPVPANVELRIGGKLPVPIGSVGEAVPPVLMATGPAVTPVAMG